MKFKEVRMHANAPAYLERPSDASRSLKCKSPQSHRPVAQVSRARLLVSEWEEGLGPEEVSVLASLGEVVTTGSNVALFGEEICAEVAMPPFSLLELALPLGYEVSLSVWSGNARIGPVGAEARVSEGEVWLLTDGPCVAVRALSRAARFQLRAAVN